LGVIILLEGRHLPTGSFKAAGPGLFPLILAVIMMISSLFLIIPKSKKEIVEESFSSWSANLRRIAPAYIALLAYFFFLKYLGFIVVTFLLITFLFAKVASLRWYVAIFGALVSTGLAYLIFDVLLESHLPKGVLGF
jgi:putative tricarboxylic transport membrane protein